MPKLFNREGQPLEFSWQKNDEILATQHTLLPVTLPNIETHIQSSNGQVGLWFEPENEPESHSSNLYTKVSTIAVNFPQFTDGRGFSIGTLLRNRWNFRGDLLAVGEVLVDQVSYLHRCGFSHILLPDHTTTETFLRCAHPFSHAYQIQ